MKLRFIVLLFAIALGAMPTSTHAAGLEALVDKQYQQTLAILAADFPTDLDALQVRIAELDASAMSEKAQLLGVFEFLTGLKKTYANRVSFAPQEDQTEIMARLADLHEAVYRGEGWQVCGRLAVDGGGVLIDSGLGGTYAGALDTQSAAYFHAVVDAIERPIYHGEITDPDWSAVTQELLAAGAEWAVVATVSSGDPKDPGLCPSLAAFFRAIAVSKSTEGERARAAFVQNVIGY
jgi:hypothetical protein